MRTVALAVAASLVVARVPDVAAAQGRADLCCSAWTPTCAAPTNTLVFACPTAGNRTLPPLAADGWIIGHLLPSHATMGVLTVASQLVVGRAWIFRSGFDGG